MKVGLDTSVVVRLLTGEPADLAQIALRFVRQREQAKDRLLVSDEVLAETYYAVQHYYEVSKEDALAALRDFVSTPTIEATGEAAQVLETPNLHSARPGFVDRLIHAGYRRAGADQIATFERAARRLPGMVALE